MKNSFKHFLSRISKWKRNLTDCFNGNNLIQQQNLQSSAAVGIVEVDVALISSVLLFRTLHSQHNTTPLHHITIQEQKQ